MTADGLSVIHAGELIPAPKALALMMEEFTPFGYTTKTINRFVTRAFRATQNFLSELQWEPVARQKEILAATLAKDAAKAAQWRAQPREVREAHARERRLEEEWEEAEAIKVKKADTVLTRNKIKKAIFDDWQRKNEIGGRDSWIDQRIRQRKSEDARAYRIILARIKEYEQQEEDRWANKGDTFDAMLDLLSDHDYIEWMFSCAERGYVYVI